MARKERNGDASETASPTELAVMAETTADLAASFIQPLDASWLDGVEIERIVPLADGTGVRGVFLGAGGDVELSDPVTGEVRPLGTWRIRVSPKVVIRLLDSARLRSDLGKLPADGTVKVRVMRLGSVNTAKGRRVTDYVVGIEQ